jgi:dihydrofolate synthase/folylpolyglutamate synthase
MLANKEVDAFLAPFAGKIAHMHALPVPGHDHHPPERFAAIAEKWGIACTAHANVSQAIGAIADECAAAGDTAPKLLIGGSLYLAGEILRLNDQLPD